MQKSGDVLQQTGEQTAAHHQDMRSAGVAMSLKSAVNNSLKPKLQSKRVTNLTR